MNSSVLWESKAEDTSYSYFCSTCGSKRLICWCYTHIHADKHCYLSPPVPEVLTILCMRQFKGSACKLNRGQHFPVSSLLEWTEPQSRGVILKTLCTPEVCGILTAGQTRRALPCDLDMSSLCASHLSQISTENLFELSCSEGSQLSASYLTIKKKRIQEERLHITAMYSSSDQYLQKLTDSTNWFTTSGKE